MKKMMVVLDLARFVVGFLFLYFFYAIVEDFIVSQLTGRTGLGVIAYRLFTIDGLGILVGLFISMWMIRQRYRVVAGTVMMVLFLLAFLVTEVIDGYKNFPMLLFSVASFSFMAVGACSAIKVWMAIPTPKKIKQKTASEVTHRNPKTSWGLVLLSLVSVPATYLTLFLSSIVTLGLTLFVLALMLELPRIPVIILAAIAFAPLVSAWASFRAVKAVFFNKPSRQTAVVVDYHTKTKLIEAIQDVCWKVGTKLPDAVILHAAPTFFVTEGSVATLNGVVHKRILAIGAPLLPQLALAEFKAVLAHEFAHFSGNDTAYSRFVVPVYKSLHSAILDLAGMSGGGSMWAMALSLLLLIPNVFLQIFLTYFATIDNMLSRSRELRADWIAAKHYGKKNVESMLRTIVQISEHFSEINATLGSENKNIFTKYQAQLKKDRKTLDTYIQKAMVEEENEFNSHPTLATRLASLPDVQSSESSVKMTMILKELEEEEHVLSDLFQGKLREHVKEQTRLENANMSFDLLNRAQSVLVRKIIDAAKKESAEEADAEIFLKGLVLGDAVLDMQRVRAEKVVRIVKRDKEAYTLFCQATANRIEVYKYRGLEEEAERIEALCKHCDIDIKKIWQDKLMGIEEFCQRVTEYCK